jgi:hypothetical protein
MTRAIDGFTPVEMGMNLVLFGYGKADERRN